MRTIHAGTANFAAEDGGAQRLLFALTFRNPKASSHCDACGTWRYHRPLPMP